MDLKQIEKLMVCMNRHGLNRFSIKKEGFELELEKNTKVDSYKTFSGEHEVRQEELAGRYTNVDHINRGSVVPQADVEGQFISSPMVGTFYLTPSPDKPSFVKVGDSVSEDTVVCIIEAMKVMNEVKAGVNGVISEILVDTNDPVQFGTKLFKIV